MTNSSDLEQRIAQLEATVRDLETCNQGNVTALLRVKAHASAVFSLFAEVTHEQGVPVELLSEHFRIRTEYYLHQMLSEAENTSPTLGAVLDDRHEGEVPEFDGYPPLFPLDDEEEDEGEEGEGDPDEREL